ncbi:MAG: HIT domain-containing protein [Chlamydiales bacterium]|nr:HIT domain-containing protein [Chlamydiales bacterium]
MKNLTIRKLRTQDLQSSKINSGSGYISEKLPISNILINIIGINCGRAAGQSVHHLHVHVIPRYQNDVKHPKGGIRGVIPEKQSY